MTQYLKEILFLLEKDCRKLPMMILMFLGVSLLDLAGLGLIGPYIALIVDPETVDGSFAEIIDFLKLPREQRPLLIILGLVLFGIFLIKAVVALGINYAIINFSQKQRVRLGSQLMLSYQSLPYTEYLRRNSSEYIYAIQELTGHFSGVVMTVLHTLSNGIIAVAILTLLAFVHGPALVLLVGTLGIILFGYDRGFRRKLQGYGRESNVASKRAVQCTHEGIEGLREIRVLGKEAYFHQKVIDAVKKFVYSRTKQLVLLAVPRYLLELMMVSFIVLLVVGVLLTGENLTNLLPILGVFGVAGLRLIPSANTFSTGLVDLRFRRDAISLLYRDVKNLAPMNIVPADSLALSTGSFQDFVIKRVSFRYPETLRDALHDVSLEILASESVGLVGPSGSGKTTLVDVVLGLLDPREGTIHYNGSPLSEALPEWRSQIAYLPQESFLIDHSLRCNVALAVNEEAIDEERLNDALSRARLSELVAQLPKGVNTLLGERGVRLSGGQRQRVAIARAFYYGRSVLVMDEATSALDYQTEREIIEEIKLLKGRVTMIVIAHRLTTVQHCDRIYRLDQGRIVESGPSQVVLT